MAPSMPPGPPGVFPGAPTDRAPRRPKVVVAAALVLALQALLFAANAPLVFVISAHWEDKNVGILLRCGFYALMALIAIVAAILMVTGSSVGRVFAAGVAGAGLWESTLLWEQFWAPILSNESFGVSLELWAPYAPVLMSGVVGFVLLCLLAPSGISRWEASRRR